MKIALLISHSRVSPVFGTAEQWLQIEATADKCTVCKTMDFKAEDELEILNELLKENIEMVICGAIPYYLEMILINRGCEVFAFIAGEVDEVLQALHLDQLDNPKFKMPGCQRRKGRGKKAFCQQMGHR